jgi:hypothetical protein
MQALNPSPALANPELMAGALTHLNHAFLGGCPRSCAIATFLLGCLAQDESCGQQVCAACGELSETIRAWGNLSDAERAEHTPWLARFAAA